MKFTSYVLPLAALGAAAFLVVPAQEALGWSTIGGSLGTGQRDFRVRNNFADASANNNTASDANFPGWDGAELAIWKGCVEWNSSSHGDGSGDPTQGNIGDGGANFDAFFAGATGGIGSRDNNIHSAITSCSSGVLAFTETPISNGWRIRYCESWTWQDGPGNVGGGIDLQGVACHEFGHALGLGHSNTGAATMFPSISGTGVGARSIHSDDMNGVRAVYGTAAGSKPSITGIAITGSTLTVSGSNFAGTGNEVWFTNQNSTSTGTDPRVRVTGLGSTGGGSTISVTIPSSAGPGNILVKVPGSTHSTISNTWPLDPSGVAGQVVIASVVPSVIENLIPGTSETITINGSGFTASTQILLNGLPIAGASTFVSGAELTFEWEMVSSLGIQALSVVDGAFSDATSIVVIANASATLQVGNGEFPNTITGSTNLTVAGQPGDLHYVLVSTTGLPSVLPGKISLGLGNSFTEIIPVGFMVVGANGTSTMTVPLTGLSLVFLYWQSIDVKLPLAANYPLASSNLQLTFTP